MAPSVASAVIASNASYDAAVMQQLPSFSSAEATVVSVTRKHVAEANHEYSCVHDADSASGPVSSDSSSAQVAAEYSRAAVCACCASVAATML